jgi:hypothetical protein
MTIIQNIRESVNNCPSITNPLFVHGRSSDTALDSAKELNIGTFVYLEPITKTIGITDQFKTDAIVIGFLTQDEPDSESDEVINEESQLSMEEKIAQMETESIAWLNYFLDNYTYSISGTFTLQPVYRIKSVMTGVLLTLTVIEPNQC